MLYLEVLKKTGDITLNKIGRLGAERKWQLALKTYSPFGLNTVPSPKDGGVTSFVITYSATAVEAAKLVKTLKGDKIYVKAPLVNPTVTGSDSSQDLTTLVNALDEVKLISISMIIFLFINQAILLFGQCPRLETTNQPIKQPNNQPTNFYTSRSNLPDRHSKKKDYYS